MIGIPLQNRITDFIPRALTRARELTVQETKEYDYYRYQNDTSQELIFKVSETYAFLRLLNTPTKGGLTSQQLEDLLDFFIEWLDLYRVIPATYNVNVPLMLEQNLVVPIGQYALQVDLAAEIAARIAGDQALSDRIDDLVFDIDLPEGFFDNYVSSFAVVFDDDPRLHTHANKEVLDAIDVFDVINVKALSAHFQSIGNPGGVHVSAEDRALWNSGGGGGALTAVKTQRFVMPGGTSTVVVTGGTIDKINYVTVNGNVKYEGVDYTRIGNTIDFGDDLDDGDEVIVSYFEGISIGAGGGVYDLTSPTTTTVGGLAAGTDIAGQTWQQIIEKMVNDYLEPTFTAFNITEIPSLIEVGTTLSGAKTFTWSTSNSANVQPNSIDIRDVTANTLIATGLANDGSESISIGVITNTAPMTRAWRAEGDNTEAGSFQSANKTVQSIYPWFYGKVASGGAAPGASRPAANQALINSGTKVVSGHNGTLQANFASGDDDYIWFAYPSTSPTKTKWYVDELNSGDIGGGVSAGGNLFPAPVLAVVNSPTGLWTGIEYKVFISNYQTASAVVMQLQN